MPPIPHDFNTFFPSSRHNPNNPPKSFHGLAPLFYEVVRNIFFKFELINPSENPADFYYSKWNSPPTIDTPKQNTFSERKSESDSARQSLASFQHAFFGWESSYLT